MFNLQVPFRVLRSRFVVLANAEACALRFAVTGRPRLISPELLEDAILRFKKAIIELALVGELTHHLLYPPGGTKPEDTTNHRNGTSGKTVLTDDGPMAI